jgi:hypothetical protein
MTASLIPETMRGESFVLRLLLGGESASLSISGHLRFHVRSRVIDLVLRLRQLVSNTARGFFLLLWLTEKLP